MKNINKYNKLTAFSFYL